MEIKNHKLQGAISHPSPNHSGEIVPTVIIMHYTADTSATGAISWLSNSAARASAHLVIDRDGKVTQLVPFNLKAWHAGSSSFRGRSGVNSFSVGIELVNGGKLSAIDDDYQVTWSKRYVPRDQVGFHDGVPWHDYTEEQLESALHICRALVAAYPTIIDMTGHEDIAPGRKIDPGPLFPMASFRMKLFEDRGSDEPLPVETKIDIPSIKLALIRIEKEVNIIYGKLT